MQLYYEENATNSELMERFKVNEISPALVYAGVTTFEDILNAISRDEIPTNTPEDMYKFINNKMVHKKLKETIKDVKDVKYDFGGNDE